MPLQGGYALNWEEAILRQVVRLNAPLQGGSDPLQVVVLCAFFLRHMMNVCREDHYHEQYQDRR